MVSSARGRACAPHAPPGTQILQAAPPTRIPRRPPSGAAEPQLNFQLLGLGTFRDHGADAALGSLPAAWLPGPKARTTGSRHGSQECRAHGLAPAPRHSYGARRTGAPRTVRWGSPENQA